jgi:hypothetical protein
LKSAMTGRVATLVGSFAFVSISATCWSSILRSPASLEEVVGIVGQSTLLHKFFEPAIDLAFCFS